jgi:hypothetical protein
MAEQHPHDDWPLIFGKWATPRKLWKAFWDDQRVKHHPEDNDSKAWADSEPDPNAP